MRAGDVGADIGRGLLAGLIGTGVMTISSTVEMKLRGRPPSSAPADAAAKVLGVQPVGDREKQRFSQIVHWAYGTSWGAVRGLVATAGLRGARATAAHLVAVWGAEVLTLPALGVAPPLTQWGAAEIAIDLFHHVVYVTATSAAFARLTRT
jgi:hypothetical protein